MLTVCRDSFPESYLLVVVSAGPAADPHALARGLHRAGRSGKRAVWLDCSLLVPADATPDTALLLVAYAEAFAAQGISVAVAHAGPELRRCLEATGLPDGLQLVNSLVEASVSYGASVPALSVTRQSQRG